MLELLFVVSVIGILAAIMIPNLLQAQVRAKISRARMEMAGIKLALGDYYVDYHAYPPPAPTPEPPPPAQPQPPAPSAQPQLMVPGIPARAASGLASPPQPGMPPSIWEVPYQEPTFYYPGRGRTSDPSERVASPLEALTTPVPYIPLLPFDPFHHVIAFAGPYGESVPYQYRPHLTPSGEGVHLDVPGLRGTFLYSLWSYGPDKAGSTFFTGQIVSMVIYDPSNGTTSAGDVVLSGP